MHLLVGRVLGHLLLLYLIILILLEVGQAVLVHRRLVLARVLLKVHLLLFLQLLIDGYDQAAVELRLLRK